MTAFAGYLEGGLLSLRCSGARELVPRSLRIELRRLARWSTGFLNTSRLATRRASLRDREALSLEVAAHTSPLRRSPELDGALQRGKERNVALGAARLDGLIIEPGQLFSYHRCVGRPSRARGFQPGLELHDGELIPGVGGGLCQVSNMLYLLALHAGLDIVERHRHSYDLFPDHERTVPFGCGATVFYNYRDLRFSNPLEQPVLIRLHILDDALHGSIRVAGDTGRRVEVYESDHRFFEREGRRMRENRIRRRFLDHCGHLLRDEEVAHNVAEVLYPCGEQH